LGEHAPIVDHITRLHQIEDLARLARPLAAISNIVRCGGGSILAAAYRDVRG
jgi:hypothetical protein